MMKYIIALAYWNISVGIRAQFPTHSKKEKENSEIEMKSEIIKKTRRQVYRRLFSYIYLPS